MTAPVTPPYAQSDDHRYTYCGDDGWWCLICKVPIRNNDCPYNTALTAVADERIERPCPKHAPGN